jgi:predicted ABC-type ATPase
MAGTPTFYLLAGPNGSGKSTLHRFLSRRFADIGAVEFVNADEIAKAIGDQDTPERAEQARLAADGRRAELLRAGTSFCSETVFSHESKIDLIESAKQAGFEVHLFVVCVENPGLSELRVQQRVARGGHRVPPNKIRERYPRTLKNLEKGILLADRCLVFDNSALSALPRLVLALEDGKLVFESPEVPQWAHSLHATAKTSGGGSATSSADLEAQIVRAREGEDE